MYSFLAVGSHVSIKGRSLVYRNRVGLYQLVRHYYNFSVKYRSIPFNIYRLTTTTKKVRPRLFNVRWYLQPPLISSVTHV